MKWVAAVPFFAVGLAAVCAPPYLAAVMLRSGRPASVAMGAVVAALCVFLVSLPIREARRAR